MARPVRPALGILRSCTNPPNPPGLLRGGQSRSLSLLLEPWAHPSAAARAHSSCTAGATAPDLSSEPLCRPPFFPSLRPPLRKGRSSPLQSSLTTRGTTSKRWWGKVQECSPALGLPPRRANSAGESGVFAAGVKSPRATGGPGWWRGSRPAVRRWGWRSRLPRGRGAQGTRRRRRRRRCCSCSRRSRRRRRRPRLSRRLH